MANNEQLRMLSFGGNLQDDETYIQHASSRKRVHQRIAFIVAACVLVALCLIGLLVLMVTSGSSSKAAPLELPGVDWGLGTSAYQVEGAARKDGREPSIWDTFAENPQNVADGSSGNITADQYSFYVDDVQLLAFLKVKYYRFSMSWSRIIKGAGSPNWTVNEAGVEYYNSLINNLRQNSIIPVVTLYHWDLPDNNYINATFWLQDSSELITREFLNYASTCFSRFGDRVKLWNTFNEPWTFITLGYGGGGHAPGIDVKDLGVWRAGHNVLLAHAATVNLYRTNFSSQQGKVFIALNSDWAEPLTSHSEDVEAAKWNLDFRLGWFADPIFKGDYPASMKLLLKSRLPEFTPEQQAMLKGSADVFGLNSYTTYWIGRATAPFNNSTLKFWTEVQSKPSGELIGAASASEWLKVVPWGFGKLLRYVHERYDAPEIWITENGVSVPGEDKMSNTEATNDKFRVEYFRSYLTEMSKAIKDGVKVKSYIAWSLLDNFEWARGFTERFGVVRVDLNNPSDLTRYLKRSALFLKDVFVFRNATASRK